MFIQAIRIVMVNNSAMMLATYASIIGISWMGAKLIVAGQFTTGELTSMFAYATTILMSLMMFTMIFVMLALSMASFERIVEVLETESSIISPVNAVTEVADGSIEFDHVTFGYADADEKRVLTDINLSIKSGEVIGILGGTGSGKTSLIQLLPRMYDAKTGHVRVGDRDVKEYDLDILRKEVAMVLQTNVLFTGTIKENMRWGNKNATKDALLNVGTTRN
nr:ABC transporter ATP-binding protein [Streptococcus sp. X16XC17]